MIKGSLVRSWTVCIPSSKFNSLSSPTGSRIVFQASWLSGVNSLFNFAGVLLVSNNIKPIGSMYGLFTYIHERWKMATWTRGNGLVNIPYMDPMGNILIILPTPRLEQPTSATDCRWQGEGQNFLAEFSHGRFYPHVFSQEIPQKSVLQVDKMIWNLTSLQFFSP